MAKDKDDKELENMIDKLQEVIEDSGIDLDDLFDDFMNSMAESPEGLEKLKDIVTELEDYSDEIDSFELFIHDFRNSMAFYANRTEKKAKLVPCDAPVPDYALMNEVQKNGISISEVKHWQGIFQKIMNIMSCFLPQKFLSAMVIYPKGKN